MIIKYINVKYSYLKINSKIKNELSYKYEDKYLNDDIYVLNSNLVRQSFVRRQHLCPWWFALRIKNVSVYKEFSNKWDIFNVFPIKSSKIQYNQRLIQEQFYFTFYKKLVKSKKYSDINFKYFKNNFKYLIKWRNRQRFVRLYSFFKTFRQIKKFWKRGFFATYNGHIFSMNRRFMRLKKNVVFFRGELKNDYKNFLMGIKLINMFIKNKNFDKYSFSKLFIYSNYLLYLISNIKYEFLKLSRTRLNKKGPFYSFFMFQRKPIRVVSYFLKYYLLKKENLDSLCNKTKIIETSILLQFYYQYFNPVKMTDSYKIYYIQYLLIHDFFIRKFKPLNLQLDILNVLNLTHLSFNQGLNIGKIRTWKKFRKVKTKRRYSFRKQSIKKNFGILLKVKNIKPEPFFKVKYVKQNRRFNKKFIQKKKS